MDDPIGRWPLMLVLAVCVFLCRLLSEALRSANEVELREKNDAKLNALLDAPDGAVYALALVRTFCLLWLAILVCRQFANTAGQALLCALALTPLSQILLHLTPAFIGEKNADKLVPALCGFYHAMNKLFKPFIFINERLARLLSASKAAQHEEVTERDIRAMVDISEESGNIEGDERDMIENVFDFGDMTAADCMVHRTDMTAIWIGDDEKTIAKTIEETGLSRFPVYDEDIDDLIGILFARDFLINCGKETGEKKPLRALLREPYFVPETVKADTLLRNMQHAKTHMAIVVDEYGGVSGLVTMEDLLEEIVGDIFDEYDTDDETEIKQVSANVYRISGAATLDSINEALDIALPESEDYDTLGGLFLSRFTEIPEDGTTPETDIYVTPDLEKPEDAPCDLLHIKVEKLEDRRVDHALVTKSRYTPPAEEEHTEENA